ATAPPGRDERREIKRGAAGGKSRRATAPPGRDERREIKRAAAGGKSRRATAPPGRDERRGGLGGHFGAPHLKCPARELELDLGRLWLRALRRGRDPGRCALHPDRRREDEGRDGRGSASPASRRRPSVETRWRRSARCPPSS